nr:iron uptake regulator [Coxiella endosymbiont of Amblyomma americanum]
MKIKNFVELDFKITFPRLMILGVLENSEPHHMSAEGIYRTLVQMGKDIGLATVYRVLSQFEASGLVKRNNFDDGHCVFEINQGRHHDHLVCVICGKVEEFIDDVIESRQVSIAKRSNFIMTNHSLTIYGICQPCKRCSFTNTKHIEIK